MVHKAPLQVSVLGELQVQRAGAALPLPPSRKTRALLAYLALTGRPHRRERLCSMFWDVADDPRGALRWSLSKLRNLVDEAGCRRIEADRESVRFSPEHCQVDVLQLRSELQHKDLEGQPVETLRAWADAFRGELLEGLDLPDFDDYQAWCIAEREETRAMRAQILSALTDKLADSPVQALPYARARVQADPLEPAARIDLVRLALSAGRPEEAEQHYASGRRMLEELGRERAQELVHAWERLRAAQPPAAAPALQTPTAAGPADPIPDSSARPLVGRRAERQRLSDALSQTATHRTLRVRLLSGEPGAGKSRLLQALKDQAIDTGASVLQGAAYEAESARPYGPFIDALRELRRGEHELGAELGLLLPELGEARDEGASRDRLFASVSDLIAAHTEGAPLLIVLDDVQWLDRASSELLHYIARTNLERPLLIVLATRSEELADNAPLSRALRSLRRDADFAEEVLSPLDEAAIGELVGDLDAGLSTEQIYAQSGGNPLFALELARGARPDTAQLPTSITDAVRDRLEDLSVAAVDVLRWGAVLGTGLTVQRLETLMAMTADELVEALEALERNALLRCDAVDEHGQHYRFSHEVVRQVVYVELSEPRRRLMHRKVADMLRAGALVDESTIAEVAHHATLGQDDDLAASTCAQAGKRCLKVFANEQAVTLARRGLRHARRLASPMRVQRTIELKEIQLMAAPRDEDTPAHLQELEVLAEQALDEGSTEHARLAFHVMSFLSWEGGNWNTARELMMQAESAARQSAGAERVRALAESGRCLLMLERDVPHGHAMLMEAEARGRTLDEEFHAVPDGMGMVKLHRGELDEALQLFEKARALAEASRDRMEQFYALEHAAVLRLEQGDYAALGRLASKLLRLADKLREGSEAPFARAVCALARTGSGEDAEDELQAALGSLREVDAKHRLSVALLHAALIDLEAGRPQRALERAEEALPIARLLERKSETLVSLTILARACQDQDQAAAAQHHRRAIDGEDFSGASAMAKKRFMQLLEQPPAPATHEPTEHAWS